MSSDRKPGSPPWSAPVQVFQIPPEGLDVAIEADAAQRDALAALGGIRAVKEARATFHLAHRAGGAVAVTGRLDARVEQTCVVTLDPVTNDIREEIDVAFAPPEHTETQAAGRADDAELPDPPEPIERGAIDLGRVAAEALFLGLDPYPRKPDALFEIAATPPDPEDHPFAALSALKKPD